MNAEGLELGDSLRNFKEFTLPLDPEMRGLTISNSEEIRTVHNSFAPQGTLHFSLSTPQPCPTAMGAAQSPLPWNPAARPRTTTTCSISLPMSLFKGACTSSMA
jgi:hypothetical protein